MRRGYLLPLNDIYMIDALLRLLVEKLYRIIYSLYCPLKTERNIRKQSREEMAKKIDGNVGRKNDLDLLYANYSILIHHTDTLNTDNYNFRELAQYDESINVKLILILQNIIEIYIEEFVLKVLQSDELELAMKLNLSSNLTPQSLLNVKPLL